MKAISDVKMNDIIQRLGKVKTVIQSNSAETNANYAGKPLTFSYTCTSELPTLTQDTALAFWKLRGGGVAEIQSFSLYSLNQFLKQHFVPKSSAGMVRDAEDDGLRGATKKECAGTNSKIYSVLVSEEGDLHTYLVDYKHVSDFGNGSITYPLHKTTGSLKVSIDTTNNKVVFELLNTLPDTALMYVCGYC